MQINAYQEGTKINTEEYLSTQKGWKAELA